MGLLFIGLRGDNFGLEVGDHFIVLRDRRLQSTQVVNGLLDSGVDNGQLFFVFLVVGSLQPKTNTFQVEDVHKPLFSIFGCADMGFDCFLGQNGRQLRDRITGEPFPLESSLYRVRMWVRQDPNVKPN